MQNNHIKTDFIEFLAIDRSVLRYFCAALYTRKKFRSGEISASKPLSWSCYPSKIGRSLDGNIQISQQGKKKKQQFFQQQYKNVRGKKESMKF